jgi:hypothetical protein
VKIIESSTLKILGFKKLKAKEHVTWKHQNLPVCYSPSVHSNEQFWRNFLREVIVAGKRSENHSHEIARFIMLGV